MANWLHSKQEEKRWTTSAPGEGVVLKRRRGVYTCAPNELAFDDGEGGGFAAAVAVLNVKVAMTVSTRVIKILLHHNTQPYVEIDRGLRVQVLQSMALLPRCQKHQFAAFIADRGLLVVWDDQPDQIVGRVERLEAAVMKTVWENALSPTTPKDASLAEALATPAKADGEVEGLGEGDEKTVADTEAALVEKPRRIVLMQSILCAGTLGLTVISLAAGYRQIAVEIAVDGSYMRLLFVLVLLPQVWLALFFFQALVGSIAQTIGPISQMKENTKFFSGIAPRRLRREDGQLPHVTIQCPVYKEGLTGVIEPTIRSIKDAMSTYEMQGGSANIFINDDGMQLLDEEEAQERQEFYEEHNIGWVARPKHCTVAKEEGDRVFLRRGKFKKASNMNYALWVSQRIEDKLAATERPPAWTLEQESELYHEALRQIIEEDEGRTWADGNVRMGDYILLIDSDTRVPKDCLLDAVSEMSQSPQVAIIQHASGVMNVTDSFFERGITFFTNLIYTQIRYAVANGDVAPFVGHNAILSWRAMQEISYQCPHDEREKFWSENTVSEDFDMALRLQTAGYLVRLAAYSNGGFEEGVSLTVYDELMRWEKYAYGCNELIFHPVSSWFRTGPFTQLFRNFIKSAMPLPSKITIMAYIGTYYALGSSWLFTLLNYFVVGWLYGYQDSYYSDSFKIIVAIIAVFTLLGNVALAALRYRLGERALIPALIENLKWIPLLFVFLGGVSLHVSQALLAHMFGISMVWGATSKEAENVSFFEEIPRVLGRFKWTFVVCGLLTALMIIMATMAPAMWRIEYMTAIVPLAMVVFSHFMLPIVLNPNLMLFTW
ncbi:hypothetical protein BT63DRAFT_431276 [Microthyrium microscopicum]|uniref:Uncharacterized protein n=1 Tax=Microthyrium microscopicum TaxID=703497 RepID=A0A6A6UMC8_9PEZI|nr:hypothetical protein BT63DRAFT_431276 [Microthyrium microscopicum]